MTGTTAPTQSGAPAADPVGGGIERLIATAIAAALILALLPLLIPVMTVRIAGEGVATRAWFWISARWHLPAALGGIAAVTALVTIEVLLLAHGIQTGELTTSWDTVQTVIPWLVVSLFAGVLLVPAAWLLRRRKIAGLVRARQISDVVNQTRIETARKVAADATAARRIGVHLDTVTGKITGITPGGHTAPHPIPGGGSAFAVTVEQTVTTAAERFRDRRAVRDWIDAPNRMLVLPGTSSSVRALVIAESGSGKTVLLNGMILCALAYGWPVFFLDAKGDPADATHLAALARSQGKSAGVADGWNLFTGTTDQVTAKLMRLMPSPDGANQHYLDEIRGVLQAVQDRTPVTGIADLRDRLLNPGEHVRDQYDLRMVNNVVDREGTTAGERALQALLVALRPLEPWLSEDGWTYDRPAGDITIVPLSPVDDAQARLGDLLLLDLRNFLATRLRRGDKTPVLVVVDEFPQLVTDTSDPGDTAGSLFETARSAGVGLVLATQSPAGLSNDETRRRRALTSGAALIFGRSKDPEDVVQYAGTVMQMEASGTAQGDELRSARAQHTWVIPPQDVREAADGAFWLVQAGAIAAFRALPQAQPAPTPVEPAPVGHLDEDAADEITTVDQEEEGTA
ncbi:ATP-binding protein [Schumannella sp. 10F1B-5-1]|uniref:ATP-binding protein n=1 Tax=Schumannella sp. 10F1B-5-1 TaxID=2590780 RepID=UPI001130FBC1|nr:ATP-binding protein [Schumannella sp. 10F1B-5-1]TPW78405.1 hypothetical protein FJ658_00945 [Schumannella sp. 10F1B-5-1]